MTGTYDTSDTAGSDAPHADLRGVTSAFDYARAADLAWALRAMDPADEAVSPNVVQTSPGLTVNRGDPDGDRQRITDAAARAKRALEEAGLELDPHGTVRWREHTAPWQNHVSGVGPMTVVDEHTDRSAG
jgi:hypothetical protein